MRSDYATLGARARGLGLHLCSRQELERWCDLPDTPALARALQGSARLDEGVPELPDAAQIEAAQRRASAAHLAVLARWADDANPVLDAFFATQERRSLRALLRGAVEGAAAPARLAGLLPTPRLGAPLLAELAQARTAREVAMRLFVLGDAHAQALVELTAQARVDLLDVERALARVLAQRWRDAARRGDAALRDCLRQRIDLINVQAALELAASGSDLPAPALFIAGGQALDRPGFVDAAGAATRAEAAARLARRMPGHWVATWLVQPAPDPAQLDAQALRQEIAALRQRSRVEPLGSAPLWLFLSRLEATSRDLRRVAWGLELGLPAAELRQGLVSP